ncbi:MAG TPA: hypothetical protein P5533_01035 [Candidatus Cloacimonadota bacterium]|nr:hypothetical protein [Candidatus Cloacimonadota bacterium]
MKLRAVFFSLLVLVLLSSCFVGSSLVFFEADAVGKPNLVHNPGFLPGKNAEQGLPGWTLINIDEKMKIPVSYDTVSTAEGKTSLRFDPSEQDIVIVSDAFRVRRYGGYYIRANVRGTADLLKKVQLRFFTYNENGKQINKFQHKFMPGADWDRYTISAGFIDTRSTFGRVALVIPAFSKGSIWIDEVGAFDVHSFRID